MGLKSLVLGAAMAAGVSCAGVPKFVCTYGESVNSCRQELKGIVVRYEIDTLTEPPACRINVVFIEDHAAFSAVDLGCADAAGLYIGMLCSKENKNVCDINIKERYKDNPDSESFFKDYDALFRDKEFQKFKKEVFGGKK